MIKSAVHYAPGDVRGSACGLPCRPSLQATVDLDAVTCGNCLSGRLWRQAISARDYKADYERFHGPGGFLDRAGQTTPAGATTAPQARAAFARVAEQELRRLAAYGRDADDGEIIAAAVRSAVETLTRQADNLVRLALDEAAEAAGRGQGNG